MSNQVEQLEAKPTAKGSALSSSLVGKIIVVDDEPELRSILVETLSGQGFEVTGCSSGQQALAELRQREFHLLLTDLMMPEMDGIALIEAAHKVDPHLIGIMMTSQGTIQTAVDAMKLGAFDYVLKPFRIQTLLPVLTRAIATRRLRMENLQLRETVAIYGLCQTIAFTLDTQTVLSRLADAALQQSDADEVSILLPTSDGKELYVAVVRGENRERLLGERVPLQQNISSWVARERMPLILNGEVHDERFVALWPRPEIRSAVSVPLQVANKLLGIINLNVTRRLRPFTLGQVKALTILAGTAAAALESASLYTQVQQAEENYRSIFENAVEGIFQSTSDSRLLTVNPSMAHILGYESPEEVINSFTDIRKQLFVDPTLPAEVTRALEERGIVQGFEFEAYRKDGAKIWLSLNMRVVRDEKGAEICREGTMEDVTERKRAEAERVIFEIIQGVITTCNLDELFKLIHRSIGKLLYAENCFVGLCDETTSLMHFEYWVDQFDPVPPPHPSGKGFSNYVVRTNKPLLLTEELKSQIYGSGEVEKSGRSSASWLGVPLRMSSRAMGVLVVQHYEDKHAYSQRDLEFLSSVGDQIALAIERKRGEEALQETVRSKAESLALLDSILSTAPIGFAFHSRDLVYQRINESLAAINGLPVKQHLGKTLREVLPQMSVVLEPLLQRVIDTGEPILDLEIIRETPADLSHQHYWLVSFYPVRMQGGELLGVGVLVSEITQRKRAEDEKAQLTAEIESQRQRLDNLVSTAPCVVWEAWGQSNVATQRTNFVNDYVETMLGYTVKEWLSTPNFWLTIVHPDDKDAAARKAGESFTNGKTSPQEFRWIAKDGHAVWVESNSVVIKDDEGRPAGLRGVTIDITERKRVEEKQARRAAHALFRADVSAALAVIRAPLRTTLESCVAAMVEHLGAAFARIWTLNREEDILELQASAGMYTHVDGPHSRVPVGSFKIGKIAQERAPHITNEVQTDPRVSDKEWARREAMVAFAGYPLLLENRLLGVMAMFSREELAEDTLDALASVAELISQGIERKRAENELRESEERYRDLVENAHDFIYEHDLEGNYTSTNKAGAQITGYSLAESLKLNLKQTVAPAYLEKAEQMFRRKLAGDEVTAYDLEIVAKDGHHVAVEVNTRLVLKDGVPVGIQGIARDITKRKRAEEALRESEARKRAILESSMDCIITMDHEGLVVDWNPAAEKTFGYSQKETIGKEMAVLIIPPRFREQHRQGLARYIATGKGRVIGQRLELSAERRDGTEFPIELTITRIESRGAPMFTGYLRDITERKKAESRLSAQYAATRALAESNTISEGAARILQAICESLEWEYGSLWTVDRRSNVLRCSQVWQAPGADADEFETGSRQLVFAPGIGLPGRVWNDGKPVWIVDVVKDTNFPRSSTAARVGLHGACAFPIRFRSEILGVVEFFSRSIREPDPELLAMMVTIGSQIGQFIERKRVEEALGESEEQLRQSQKLEAIGQLAGGVAHDFNNLLTVIGGYSSILLGKLPRESPHVSSIEEIKKASDRASALTRQLLAFSRKQILQPKVLDLNTVVTDLEKMVRRLIGEDIDLLTITSPVLGKAKADPGQIEQVLLNLIVNARDAMPKGGKLTMETHNVVHSEEYAQRHAAQPGPYVMLAVSDNGCGMDATIQSRLFEPFFTTKGSGKGTGLGLATVYGIVKQSGGNISVYSEVGRGSTFKVYLPRVDEAVEGEDEVISRSVPQGTEVVLLVEDEDQVRAILKHILEGQGYHVLSASNGEEAFSISQDPERDIKLMITDVVMPQMSGRELAERVLAVRPNLPVLFMSGYTDDAIVRHGLLDEKLNFIQKPFDLASVARKVREVLDSHL